MPNCAKTAEFRVGRSADVVYVQFYAHVISDVKTNISEEKESSQSQTEMVAGLEIEKNLEDERRGRASLCFPASRSECLTDRFPEKILQIQCSMEGQRLGAKYRRQKTETQ